VKPGPQVVHLTADETSATTATLANTSLLFTVVSGLYYQFVFDLVWQTSDVTVGLKIGLTTPTLTRFTAMAQIVEAADANNAVFSGTINSSGDSVSSSGGAVINTDLPARITGVILPSASGTLRVQYAAETTGATVTLKRASCGILTAV